MEPTTTLQRFISGPPPEGYLVTLATPGYKDFRRSNIVWATARAIILVSRKKKLEWSPRMYSVGGSPKYVVYWVEGNKKRRKSFSVEKYGDEEARFRAESFWNGYVMSIYAYILAQETMRPVFEQQKERLNHTVSV